MPHFSLTPPYAAESLCFQLLYSAYLASVNIIYPGSFAQLETLSSCLVLKTDEGFSGGVDPVLSSFAIYAAPASNVVPHIGTHIAQTKSINAIPSCYLSACFPPPPRSSASRSASP